MMEQLKAWKEENNLQQPEEDAPIQLEDPLDPEKEGSGGEESGNAVESGDSLLQSAAENGTGGEKTPEAGSGQNNGSSKEVLLYFASADGTSLEAETRAVNAGEGIARAAVRELIAGPDNAGLYPTIPAATILEDINITPDGLCTVDFSPELIEDHPGGSLAERLTVYSIVNTLSQFDSVNKVQILVGGRRVNTLAGHCDIAEAMARYDGIIK
ncbi:MAG: GerMN domain-containing protein [Firmicutes bacterium]|nr:GerMN domain-containing protein [Bacillota bacterium]